MGDFNGDGIQDLAVTNYGSSSSTILKGNGDGTFTALASPATGTNPISVAVGDFNSDGIADLAVANSGGTTLTILRGVGNGTFTALASPTVGMVPSSVAVGDFNGDGIVDLAVSNQSSSSVSVLKGNGDGTFTTAASPGTGAGPKGLVVADFNGDGLPDIATANYGASTVTILKTSGVSTATATKTGVSPAGTGTTHNVDASFPGDSNYSSSVSATTALTSQVNTSTLTLTASPTSSTYGASVTLTATVNNTGATGTVTFYSNGRNLGTATVTSGVATLLSTALPVGTDSVVAVYGGDSADASSTSNTFIVTVSTATTAVGITSATQQVVFNFTSTVTLNATLATAVQVLTQGAANLDFNYVTGGTCAAGATYSSGQSCTVNFTFSPMASGQRLGAVVLYNNAATPAAVATAFVGGSGTGPLAGYSLGLQTTPYTGLSNPQEVAFDGAGNLYVTNYGTSSVIKYAAGSTVGTTFLSGQSQPFGVAVDGAGNVYISNYGQSSLVEVTAAGVQTTFGSGLSGPQGLAIDVAGTIYVENSGVPNVVKFVGGSTTPTVVAPLPAANGRNIVVDGSGNIFVADYTSGVQKIAAGASVATPLPTPGVSLGTVLGVAVDAAGNVCAAPESISQVYEIPASGANAFVIGSSNSANGIALDASGRLFITSSGSTISLTDRTQAAPLAFGSVAVGAASAAQTLTFENDGNAPLTISSIAPSNNNFAFVGVTVGGNAACGTTLASAGVCGLSAMFTPQTATTITGTGTVADNSLNTSSQQTVSFSGTGTVGTKTINFVQPATPATAGTSATLTASTSDGDPVVFTIAAGTATISGTSTTNGLTTASITYTNAGTVTIAANSATTANAAAAATVSQSVTVTAAPSSFTATTTAVSSTSPTQTAEVTFTTAGTPSTISVVTQGATGLDFAFVSGGHLLHFDRVQRRPELHGAVHLHANAGFHATGRCGARNLLGRCAG